MFTIEYSESRKAVYLAIIMNNTASVVASMTGISTTQVGNHIKGLIDDEFLIKVPGRYPYRYEKGAKAKYLDQAISDELKRALRINQESRDGGCVIGVASSSPTLNPLDSQNQPPPGIKKKPSDALPPAPVILSGNSGPRVTPLPAQPGNKGTTPTLNNNQKKVTIEEARAHIHGFIDFPVTAIGDREEILIRRDGKEDIRADFLEPDPFNVRHNNTMYKGKYKPYDRDFQVTVILHLTENMQLFRIYPPEIYLTADELEHADEHGMKFFQDDVYHILDLLEKHSGWRFTRKEGVRKGYKVGQVQYGHVNDPIWSNIPKGRYLKENGDIVTNDSSPKKHPATARVHGSNEGESPNPKDIHAWIHSRENFDKINGTLKENNDRFQSMESKVNKAIGILEISLDLIIKQAEMQGLELQHSLVEAQKKKTEDIKEKIEKVRDTEQQYIQ